MTPSGSRRRGGVLLFVLAALLLAVLLRQIRWADLALLARRLTIGQVGLLCGIYGLTTLLRGIRLGLLVGDRRGVSLAAVSGVHAFLNHLLPLRLGELSLPVLAKHFLQRELTRGSAALLVMRLYDVFAIALLILLSALAAGVGRNAPFRLGGVLAGSSLLAAGLVGLRALPALLSAGARAAARILRAANRRWADGADRLEEAGRKMAGHVSDLAPGVRYAALPAVSLLIQISVYVFFYLSMVFMGVDLGFFLNTLASSGELITSLLPINAVGSLGTLEAGWAAGFILCGVDRSTAIASGFVMHGIIVLTALLLALFGFAWLSAVRRRTKATQG